MILLYFGEIYRTLYMHTHARTHTHTHTHTHRVILYIDLWGTPLFSPVLCTPQGRFLLFSVPHKFWKYKTIYCALLFYVPYKVAFINTHACAHAHTHTHTHSQMYVYPHTNTCTHTRNISCVVLALSMKNNCSVGIYPQ